jgi:hypothetical protein
MTTSTTTRMTTTPLVLANPLLTSSAREHAIHVED